MIHPLSLLARQGGDRYGGEPISQRDHALQAAELAQRDGAPPPLVLAALLHDIAHLLHPDADTATREGRDLHHEVVGARFLDRCGFPPDVTEPIRLHVAAKRFLARNPRYAQDLSEESARSLDLQGGPLSDAEAQNFLRLPHAQDALRLRRWDDLAKDPLASPTTLDHYIALARSLCSDSSLPPSP